MLVVVSDYTHVAAKDVGKGQAGIAPSARLSQFLTLKHVPGVAYKDDSYNAVSIVQDNVCEF